MPKLEDGNYYLNETIPFPNEQTNQITNIMFIVQNSEIGLVQTLFSRAFGFTGYYYNQNKFNGIESTLFENEQMREQEIGKVVQNIIRRLRGKYSNIFNFNYGIGKDPSALSIESFKEV